MEVLSAISARVIPGVFSKNLDDSLPRRAAQLIVSVPIHARRAKLVSSISVISFLNPSSCLPDVSAHSMPASGDMCSKSDKS
ncbi:hypothetical protein JCM18918_2657 [Cutibacterium acnes JCM 18918]|nr:hypothetical protein JCM18918_2657 [Cutibacterium acnes JCM 18918]